MNRANPMLDPDDPEYPPGTVLLGQGANYEEDASSNLKRTEDGNVVLNPQPSDDPNDPLNWSTTRKLCNFSIVNFYTFMVFTSLNVSTVLWGPLESDLGYTNDNLVLSSALGALGLALGCSILIPLSILYGRKPVYVFTAAAMVATNVWQMKQVNLFDLLGSNIISGLAGAASESLIQVSVHDMFFVHQRGLMNGIYTVVVVFGNFVMTIPAGYIANSYGWSWVFGMSTIMSVISLILLVFVYEETKYVRLPQDAFQQSTQINKDTMNSSKSLETFDQFAIPIKRNTYKQRMKLCTPTPGVTIGTYLQYIYQPFVILFRAIPVTYVAFQYGFGFGWIALLSVCMSSVLLDPPYNFSPIGIGNLSLAPTIGAIFGILYGGHINDRFIIWKAKRNGGIFEPEMRLLMLAPTLIVTPIGIWLFGYSLDRGLHWIIPAFAIALVGSGLGAIVDITLTYLTDSYQNQQILAKALIIVAFLRSAIAAGIIALQPTWLSSMGLHHMFILSACFCFVVLLAYLPMVKYGKRSRQKTRMIVARYSQAF